MSKSRIILFLLCGLCLNSCAKLTLAWADLEPDGITASPAALGPLSGQAPVASVEDWENTRAPLLRELLEQHVFGVMPDNHETQIISRTMLDEAAFNGAGQLIEFEIQAAPDFGGGEQVASSFFMDVVTPTGVEAPPVILMQTFCPRWDTIPHPAISRPEDAGGCGGGAASGVMKYIFGRYIATPPIEAILARGYAIATIYPSEFAPDNREAGLAALRKMSPGLDADQQRWGAIAAWGWGYSVMIDALGEDEIFNASKFITYGHSRYGKSALVAAAYDERVDGVIAHQSGTGGASLNRNKPGESIKAITDSYPHWFAESYSDYAGREEAMPVDQHMLLSLVAPRPVLLGNARRDVWVGPQWRVSLCDGRRPGL